MRCMEEIEKIFNVFLCTGEPNSARGSKVSRETVCLPKNAGGLGLWRIKDLNRVFGLKFIWLLFAEQGLLWVAWIKNNITGDRHFWETDFRTSGSWIWRKLVKVRPLARPYLHCNIVSDTSVLFCHDNWTSLGPLIDVTGANGPRVSGYSSNHFRHLEFA